MKNNFSKYSALIIVTAAITLASCGPGDHSGQVADGAAPVPVQVSMVSTNGAQNINISGQVTALQTAQISTRVMGYITSLKVDVGDRVKKGQVLATISNQDILAKRAQADALIAEAKAAVGSAQKDFDRFTALYGQQSATAKELDNVTLQYSAAKARVQGAQQMRNEINAMLGYTTLLAPFSGTVTQKLADAGSMASPGMPILTVEQTGNFEITASVPEHSIGQLKPGAEAKVHIAAANKTFTGKISELNQSSQYTGGQYTINITIPADQRQGLYAGMYANITLEGQPAPAAANAGKAVLVPVSSIYHKDQLTGIYTVSSSNTALLRWVRLGKIYGDKVEVLSGLATQESFIVHADGKLYNGVPVKTVASR